MKPAISILGTGRMGSALARALVQAGYRTTSGIGRNKRPSPWPRSAPPLRHPFWKPLKRHRHHRERQRLHCNRRTSAQRDRSVSHSRQVGR
ncbi:NAD(P)-binding domain-containing protein [Rhizobium sp. BT-175]|uniref:NAD(P)-binding domain-containing protein n=1 Tax=Rhizobium sp. BT-175 TaxID=2986929 RepID=UPI00355649B2